MKLPRYWIVGLFVLIALLVAPAFRWEELATISRDGSKTVYVRDRWSGTYWVRWYSAAGTISENPVPGKHPAPWSARNNASQLYETFFVLALAYNAIAGLAWVIRRWLRSAEEKERQWRASSANQGDNS